MPATFDPALTTNKDHIRLALGDFHAEPIATFVENALLQDEIINAKLAAFSYLEALAQLADALAAQFGQKPDQYSESGGISIKWSERVASWRLIAVNARTGKIKQPSTTKVNRPGIAVGEICDRDVPHRSRQHPRARFRSD